MLIGLSYVDSGFLYIGLHDGYFPSVEQTKFFSPELWLAVELWKLNILRSCKYVLN